MKHARLLLLIPLIAVLAACGKDDGGKTIATIGGTAITERDVDDLLQAQGIPKDNAEMRKKATEILINSRLLVQYAVDQKIDKDPEVSLGLNRARDEMLTRAVILKLRKEKTIDDAAIRKVLEEDRAKLHMKEYKVSHIVVATEDEAKSIISQLRKGAPFAALARKHSMDKVSGKNGGDIGWRNQGDTVAEFFNVLPDLKKGGMTGAPVKSQFGWHIIHLADSRSLKIPTVAELMNNPETRAKVANKIHQDNLQALIKSLREKAKIQTP